MRQPSTDEAQRFIGSSRFLWHQRFELAPGAYTPGVNDIGWLRNAAPLPDVMTGMSVLDIGTTNGAMIFDCERRGASRLVAVDIVDSHHFGFASLVEFLESKAEFVQASVYELADVLDETFDLVIFWGVLYHLRHPLLGLDSLRRLAAGRVTLETAVCDATDPGVGQLARFHRLDDLGNDPSNWWSPSIATLESWVMSAGFSLRSTIAIPPGGPAERALLDLEIVPGKPEYERVSYERPLLLRPIDLTSPRQTEPVNRVTGL
jgi:tRNA (mo5U34)-methyltransferase